MTWNWDLGLLENIVINVQCETMKYEINREPAGTRESRS